MEHVLTQLILSDMRPIVSNCERPISLNGRKLADGRLQFCTLFSIYSLYTHQQLRYGLKASGRHSHRWQCKHMLPHTQSSAVRLCHGRPPGGEREGEGGKEEGEGREERGREGRGRRRRREGRAGERKEETEGGEGGKRGRRRQREGRAGERKGREGKKINNIGLPCTVYFAGRQFEMRTYIHTYIHTYVHVHTYIHTYIHTCTYIHT